ncbi:MAG: rod shape-determining protein MreC [Alistipes sp.]|nr:rod shape-determining protein MreC [Alistipes sp.]MDE5691491.1 rod shape-determining protein MreC [Alistipes sp.]MDE6507581.1 rod shape-determining protein MreC [Alistipes sp.]MDE7077487.1 rod shape-determining protein MreC [Alistipes sp.]MDE7344699.1 rod shape-determining protein MreC [Alistipes sp.]
MHKLIEFIRSIYLVVLFVVLEALAVGYYARSTFFTQARLLARSNAAAGAVHEFFAGVQRYFRLETENRVLLDRVAVLEERLAQYEEAANIDRLKRYILDLGGCSKFRVMTATVISNTINRSQNFVTINRGLRDGVTPDMALLAPGGSMLGYIVDCTDRYSVALPILNTSFRASGKLEGTDYFGSVYWDGVDPHSVLLGELSKYAEPKKGQKVVTTGFSQFFPENVLIGWVESASMNENRTAYTVRLRLATDFARLTDIILVENRDACEVLDLQARQEEDERAHVDL